MMDPVLSSKQVVLSFERFVLLLGSVEPSVLLAPVFPIAL